MADDPTPRRDRVAVAAWISKAAAITLQLAGGAAAMTGVYLLAGLGVALVIGGAAALALGVLHEAGRL